MKSTRHSPETGMPLDMRMRHIEQGLCPAGNPSQAIRASAAICAAEMNRLQPITTLPS